METGGKHLPNTEEDTMDAQDLDAKFYNKLGDLGKGSSCVCVYVCACMRACVRAC
jgi:hypothetical protein